MGKQTRETFTKLPILGLVMLASMAVTTCHGKSFNFIPYGFQTPVILLEAEFNIEIKAFENDVVVAAWVGGSQDYDDQLVIDGFQGTESNIILRFPEGIEWNIENKRMAADLMVIEKYVKFTPEKLFPPFDTLTTPLTFKDEFPAYFKSDLASFKCDTQMMDDYKLKTKIKGDIKFEVTVTVSKFHFQAFHIEDGEYSPAVHCKADAGVVPTKFPVTTTQSTTTIKTTTTKAPVPSFGLKMNKFIANHTISNTSFVICISMEGRIGFDIAYDTLSIYSQPEKKTIRIGIPQERLQVEGVCIYKPGEQKIKIKFYNDWEVEFLFAINSGFTREDIKGEAQSRLDYSIKSVSLKYYIKDELFPKAYTEEGKNFTVSEANTGDLPRKKASSGYFVCKSSKSYKMNDDVSLVLENFLFKAFIHNGDTDFYGMPGTCEEDMVQIGEPAVVIIIGCMIVSFCLVFSIAFIALITTKCGGRKKRNQYAPL